VFEQNTFLEHPTWNEWDFVVKINSASQIGTRWWYTATEQVILPAVSQNTDTTPAPLYQDHPYGRTFVLPGGAGSLFLTEINNRQLAAGDLVRCRYKSASPTGTVYEAEAPQIPRPVAISGWSPQNVTVPGGTITQAWPGDVNSWNGVNFVNSGNACWVANGSPFPNSFSPNLHDIVWALQEGQDGAGTPIYTPLGTTPVWLEATSSTPTVVAITPLGNVVGYSAALYRTDASGLPQNASQACWFVPLEAAAAPGATPYLYNPPVTNKLYWGWFCGLDPSNVPCYLVAHTGLAPTPGPQYMTWAAGGSSLLSGTPVTLGTMTITAPTTLRRAAGLASDLQYAVKALVEFTVNWLSGSAAGGVQLAVGLSASLSPPTAGSGLTVVGRKTHTVAGTVAGTLSFTEIVAAEGILAPNGGATLTLTLSATATWSLPNVSVFYGAASGPGALPAAATGMFVATPIPR